MQPVGRSPAASEVTRLLRAWSGGDTAARDALIPLVYGDLRRRARGQLARERRGHTLQPTALVHETFMRLVTQRIAWKDRAHFMGLAARLMRQVLIDHARARHRVKRGGNVVLLELAGDAALPEQGSVPLGVLDGALQELATFDDRQAQIVELRFFGGLSIEETAHALDISTATVKREWRMAKAWLHGRLQAAEARDPKATS